MVLRGLMNTKYIIIEIENVGILPIIFYGVISHNDMLTSIRNTYPNCKVESAGFVSISGTGIKAYGRSVSLDISSRPEIDSLLLTMFMVDK